MSVTKRGRANGGGGKISLFGRRIDDPAINIDGDVPTVGCGIPNEMIIRDRELEPSILVLLVQEFIAHDLVIERSVREIRPANEHLMRNVARSGITHRPLVAVQELGTVWKTIMVDEGPFFPTGAVLVDVARIDVELGLEVGSGSRADGERNVTCARAVAVNGGGVQRFGRDQGECRGQEKTKTNDSQHGEERGRRWKQERGAQR